MIVEFRIECVKLIPNIKKSLVNFEKIIIKANVGNSIQ